MSFNPPMSCTLLGLDIGASATKAVCCTPEGTVLAETKWESVPTGREPMAHLQERVAAFCPSPSAIGIAICGLIAPDGSTMLHAPNAIALQDLPYRDGLAREGVPVRLLNDAKAFTYAEHRLGAAQGLRHVLGLTLGTGIGGGLILDGNLYLGAHGWPGEIGHIPLDDDGPLCACGLRGCLEAYNSSARVTEAYNLQITDPRSRVPSVRAVIDRAGIGDPDALAIWERYGERLGTACARAITLLDLEAIVLGGGVASAFPYLRPSLIETMRMLVTRFDSRGISVRQAALGSLAGAIGAALWAGNPGT